MNSISAHLLATLEMVERMPGLPSAARLLIQKAIEPERLAACKYDEEPVSLNIGLLSNSLPYPPTLEDGALVLYAQEGISGSEICEMDTGLRLPDVPAGIELRIDTHPGPAPSRRALPISATTHPPRALSLETVEIENIRCFRRLHLDLRIEDGGPADWVLLLGENARGKSTLLRALALGLCHETEAAALLKAIPGNFLRTGVERGHIKLTLRGEDGTAYQSITEITADPRAPEQEMLRRQGNGIPLEQIFVCAYGPQRTSAADRSYDGYNRLDAVSSLFHPSSPLQNPELVFRRRADEHERMQEMLASILMLDRPEAHVIMTKRGLEVIGPWSGGSSWQAAELSTLSDGYRTTTQWVLDLIGWLIHAGRFRRQEDMSGIVLIDELEQHLHPRWQRHIVARLRRQFPHVQFIAATHTPMITLALADEERAWLFKLDEDDSGELEARRLDPHELRGLRADQVLTSVATFGLATTRSPGSESDSARYAALFTKKKRTPEEDDEMRALRAQLDKTLVYGETPYERLVERAVRKALAELSDEVHDERLERELLDLELERQLHELTRGTSGGDQEA